MRKIKSISYGPTPYCPFYDEFDPHDVVLFCDSCTYFITDLELSDKDIEARICRKDGMKPEVVYRERELNMKWD